MKNPGPESPKLRLLMMKGLDLDLDGLEEDEEEDEDDIPEALLGDRFA